MDNSRVVGLVEGIRNLRTHVQNLIDWQRSFLKPLRQRLSFHAFHHQVVDAILMADVVQRADVGMVQGRDGSCFAFEPLLVRGIRRELREDLDGDGALEPCISRTVDLSHSPHTEQGENLIRAQTR
jgi:hypothetical protein